MKRLVYLVPLMVFILVAIYFAVGLTRDPRELPSVMIDKPVPEFVLPPIEEGGKGGFASSDLKGEVQLVNVFASWCVPCQAEHPVLARLAQEQGISIRGINYKDKPEDALGWLNRNGNFYRTVGADRDGRVAIDWGVYGVPETFVIDRDGRIRYRHVGPVMPNDAEEKILPIIRELQK